MWEVITYVYTEVSTWCILATWWALWLHQVNAAVHVYVRNYWTLLIRTFEPNYVYFSAFCRCHHCIPDTDTDRSLRCWHQLHIISSFERLQLLDDLEKLQLNASKTKDMLIHLQSSPTWGCSRLTPSLSNSTSEANQRYQPVTSTAHCDSSLQVHHYVHIPWVTSSYAVIKTPQLWCQVSYCYCPPSPESLFRPWPENFQHLSSKDQTSHILKVFLCKWCTHVFIYVFKRPFLHDFNCPFYFKSYTYSLVLSSSCTTAAGTYVRTVCYLLHCSILLSCPCLHVLVMSLHWRYSP